jgi:hypothetical protein
MPEEEDTDTKLAILASLLEPATFPLEELLERLNENEGDVVKAAEGILLPRVKGAGKRKAGTSLESWLGKKRSSSILDSKEEFSGAPRPRSRPTPNLEKDDNNVEKKPIMVNLLDHLKQPSHSNEKSKNIPRPAIHLSNQDIIDSHNLPLSILKSPLSPAFASALYLTMMEESETWDRNRFYLAGKWVESPHTVCHYSRDPGAEIGGTEEIDLLDGKQGKKATYMWSGQEIAGSRVSPSPQ